MDKGGPYDVQKVVTKGGIMCKLKGCMDKGGYDVQMKGGWKKWHYDVKI